MMSSVHIGFKMWFIRVIHTFKTFFCMFYSEIFSLCSYCHHCSYSEADLIKEVEKDNERTRANNWKIFFSKIFSIFQSSERLNE